MFIVQQRSKISTKFVLFVKILNKFVIFQLLQTFCNFFWLSCQKTFSAVKKIEMLQKGEKEKNDQPVGTLALMTPIL